MIVTIDGTRRYLPFSIGHRAVVGYHATCIEIDAHDILSMRDLASETPSDSMR